MTILGAVCLLGAGAAARAVGVGAREVAAGTPAPGTVGAPRRWRGAERLAESERFYASLVPLAGKEAEVLHPAGEGPRRAARALLRRREQAALRMAPRWAALAGEPSRRRPRVRFVLFPSLESKMMITGISEEGGTDPARPDLVPVMDGEDAGLEDLAHARALSRALLRGVPDPPPGLEWGIAVHLNGSWKGVPTAALSARLAAAGALPALASLFASPSEERRPVSPLCLGPAAGSFVDYAVAECGPSAFLRAATSPDPLLAIEASLLDDDRRGGSRSGGGGGPGVDHTTAQEPARVRPLHPGGEPPPRPAAGSTLEAAWMGSLPAPGRPAARRCPAGFHRGVCLAHTNSPDGGYGGRSAARTLDALRAQGVTWISVTPFGFQRGRDATRLSFVLDGPGAETDEAMRHVIREAHRRGMKVLYKPHVWVGHGDWSGDIEPPDEAGWSEWFDAYRGFILHHALLAEEERADLFSVANELRGTSSRSREWRDTIARVRRLFGGPLTYAANWGEEVETVAFWDALDFVGVNAYYPLSPDPAADDHELESGARAVAARLASLGRSLGRPVLLTEVGFASRAGCWIDPHREIRGAPPDLSCQARAYAAVLRAFRGEPFRGLYWWKFESDPSIGGPDDSSFTPRGKPAEQAMAVAYTGRALGGSSRRAP